MRVWGGFGVNAYMGSMSFDRSSRLASHGQLLEVRVVEWSAWVVPFMSPIITHDPAKKGWRCRAIRALSCVFSDPYTATKVIGGH